MIQALVVMIPAWKSGMRLRFRWPSLTAPMRKFFILLGPAVLGSGVVQVNIFIDMMIGSYLPTGSISYLEYADRLNQLPLSVIGAAMGTALLPMLSKQIRLTDYDLAHKTQNLAIEYAMTLAMPAMLALLFLAYPIAKTVFQFGKLNPQDTMQIAYTVMAFAIGTPAYILIKIFSTVFFAHQNTKAPVYVAVLSVLVNLALNLLLYRHYAHVGLAFSTAVSAWFNAGVLMTLLRKKDHLILSDRFKQFIPKLGLSSAMAMGTIHLLNTHLWPLFDKGKTQQIIGLSILCALVLGVYGGFCFLTGIFKLSDLKKPQPAAS
jgi:putative peptidoglycan lipid II flippase